MFAFDRRDPEVERAASFLLRHQSKEGDIRGIIGAQRATHYTAGMLELLAKARFVGDRRVEKGHAWLLSVRQDDGERAFPLRAAGLSLEAGRRKEALERVCSKPFSHLLTGVVLRLFATHPRRRHSQAARKAGELLISRFFRLDGNPDRRDRSYWEKVSFPFWFTDIVSSLDCLFLLGFEARTPEVQRALQWLRARQGRDGRFRLQLLKASDPELPLWVSFAICRIFRRFHG